jgi:hypothetical protein
MAAAPLLLAGVLTGLGSTAASALTCQAWTGGQRNVWVVGGTGGRTTLIEHWTGGSTRTVVPSPNPGEGLNFLTSASGISPRRHLGGRDRLQRRRHHGEEPYPAL